MARKTTFFDGWSWFKLNNLGPALGMALIFYISVSKGFKLKVKTFWWLISTFVEVTGEKLGGEPFWPPPSWLGLRNVKKHPWRSATFSKSLLLFLLLFLYRWNQIAQSFSYYCNSHFSLMLLLVSKRFSFWPIKRSILDV